MNLNLADYQIQIQTLEVSCECYQLLLNGLHISLVAAHKSYIYTYSCPYNPKAVSHRRCQLDPWSPFGVASCTAI